MKTKMSQILVVLSVLLGSAILPTVPAHAAPDVPFVVAALAKAQTAPTSEGKWNVTANVELVSETNLKMVASGPLVATLKNDEAQLGGILPLTIGDGDANHHLALFVKRDGEVGLQWLIAGKPYLGRKTEYFDTLARANQTLVRKIRWAGDTRFLIVKLSSQWIKKTPPKIRVPGKNS